MTPVLTQPRSAGRYLFFGLAALSLMMFAIDSTIVAVAIPTMTRELNTTLGWIGWTLTAYMLTQTVMMPLAGKLSENFGRMRVFLVCVLLFTVGSLLCGIAPSVYWLIFFRVLQALGGGGFIPSATAIVAQEFPENRDRMVGLFASIFPIGGIIGPNVGGFIIEHFSWRDVFLVNVPLGLVIMALLARRAQRSERGVRRPIDFVGTALFASSIVGLLAALTLLGNEPSFWRTAPFWVLMASSLILLGVFCWHEVHTPEPILDLTLVVRNPFLAINIYNFLFGVCVFGFFSFIPLYGVLQYHLGTAESGMVLAPRSLAMMVTATISSFFLMRLGYRLPMVAGLLLVVTTLLMLSQGWSAFTVGGVTVEVTWLLAAEIALAGVGIGLAAPASNNAALDLVPDRAAVITGVRGMFRSTGAVIGTAFIVLALEFSPDRAAGLRGVFLALALILLATLPLTFLIPDTARRRRRDREEAQAAAEVTSREQPSAAAEVTSREPAVAPRS